MTDKILTVTQIQDASTNIDVLNEVVESTADETVKTDAKGYKKTTLEGFGNLIKDYFGYFTGFADYVAGGTSYTAFQALQDVSGDGTWYIARRDFISTDIATDLSNGNIIVWQGVSRTETALVVPTISGVQGLTLNEGQLVRIPMYHNITDLSGGGLFRFGTGRHNGGTFIGLNRSFPTDWNDQAQLTDWFADSGVDELGFERVSLNCINPVFFGVSSSDADATKGVVKSIESADTLGKPLKISDIFTLTSTVKIPENMYVYGTGYNSGFDFNFSGAAVLNIIGSNATLHNFKLYGKASGGIQIRAEADASIVENTVISNVNFVSLSPTDKLNQCVWLYGSTNTKVLNCNFDGTGYGVIIQFGYEANDGLVDGCSFKDMQSDAIELNSGGTVISYRWTISNNKYLGDARFPYVGNEGRFVGTASVYNVSVVGNTVINAGGDSAVHIETDGGLTTITGNTFTDCLGAQGNNGWIYLLNSTKDVIIDSNVFEYREDNGVQVAVSVTSGSYVHQMVLSNNIVKDFSGLYQFSFAGMKSVSAESGIAISGNTCRGLEYFVDTNNTEGLNITSNSVVDTNYGLINNSGATGGGLKRTSLVGNILDINIQAIDVTPNSNGTGRCVSIMINNNQFTGSGAINFNSLDDSQFCNNILSAASTLVTTGNTRCLVANNTQVGTGVI